LSSSAINEHIVPVLNLLVPLLKNANYSIAQLVIVEQGRVAIADEIGQILKADMTIIFIGERPGLSAPNSMGAYLTFNPQIGNTDEKRNCVSNIRPEGLNYTDAVDKIFYLINASFEAKLSGVNLKDEFSKSDMLH
jgi:ethanolamine ammonia-lyase small subunit